MTIFSYRDGEVEERRMQYFKNETNTMSLFNCYLTSAMPQVSEMFGVGGGQV